MTENFSYRNEITRNDFNTILEQAGIQKLSIETTNEMIVTIFASIINQGNEEFLKYFLYHKLFMPYGVMDEYIKELKTKIPELVSPVKIDL